MQTFEKKAVMFTNWSAEAFVGMWDGNSFTFEPGESKWFEEGIARHFAKHLANRELIRDKKEFNTSPSTPKDNPIFMEYFEKALVEESEVAKNEVELDSIIMEKEAKKKKGGRPKKVEKKEEEFPDLNK